MSMDGEVERIENNGVHQNLASPGKDTTGVCYISMYFMTSHWLIDIDSAVYVCAEALYRELVLN